MRDRASIQAGVRLERSKGLADSAPDARDVALGLRIRARRKAMGLSQSELSEAAGVTFQLLHRYEAGAKAVSVSTLVDLAQALGCRATDLLGDLDPGGAAIPAPAPPLGAAELLAAYAAAPAPMRRLILKLASAITRASLEGNG